MEESDMRKVTVEIPSELDFIARGSFVVKTNEIHPELREIAGLEEDEKVACVAVYEQNGLWNLDIVIDDGIVSAPVFQVTKADLIRWRLI